MLISHPPLLSEDQLNDLFNFPALDQTVESTCHTAVQHPQALYLFMQRYTHFNGYAGSLVARLASSVGLSRHLFNCSTSMAIDEADRGLEIAARILAATLDEHCDRGVQSLPHRILAQATLKSIGDYAELTVAERNQVADLPNWMSILLNAVVQGYQGIPNDTEALIKAMGFHAASEILASREYASIDRVIRYENQGHGFDAYLRRINGKVEFDQRRLSAWYWIVVHGKHQGNGVEAEHFQLALEAIDLTTHYRIESRQQIREWALLGFSNFVEIQQNLFQNIYRECAALLENKSTALQNVI